MSYINVSVSTVLVDRPDALRTTLSAGFSREGGRVELLELTTQAGDDAAPVTRSIPMTPALLAPTRGLLDAALGAHGVGSVTVTHGADAPEFTAWTDRRGELIDYARPGAVPASIQQVVDAAAAVVAAIEPAAG